MDRKRNQFACQVQKIRESIDAGKLVFQDGLSIKLIEEAISRYVAEFRDRVYTPWTTLWLFLNQVISRSSCQRCRSRPGRVPVSRRGRLCGCVIGGRSAAFLQLRILAFDTRRF